MVVFLLLAAVAGYKFISAELDYKTASDYYDTLADSFVRPYTAASATSRPDSIPAHTDSVQEQAGSSPVFSESEEMHIESPSASAESAQAGELPTPEKDTASVETQEKNAVNESPAAETPEPVFSAESTEAQYTATIIKKGRTTALQPPILVDFDGLCGENPDVVGWIYCEDTPINYPVLQGEDNKKYLTIQPDGRTSGSGSVFIDCNCESEFTSDNTIMYGHNLKNKMFSSLSRYSSQSYYNKHPVMWLLTPDQNYMIELFAGFVIKDGGWVYVIDFPFPGDWEEFTEACLKNSFFRSMYPPEKGDRLITLSTCDYTFDNARYVVVGSLIRSINN